MATGIVSAAAGRYGLGPIAFALLAVAAAGFLALAVLYVLRSLRFWTAVLADLAAPDRAFGYFTIVAAAAVLGERVEAAGLTAPALALVALAGVAWLVLGYAVPLRLMVAAEKPGLGAASGSWLLWVVATQAVSTSAAMIATREPSLREAGADVAVTTWAVGSVLYLALITVLLLRLLVERLVPEDFSAPYWITMGATAITVLAGARILALPAPPPMVAAAAPVVSGLSLMLWAFGSWWVPLLVLLFFAWRHGRRRRPLTYSPELWAMVFPLGMYSAASGSFGEAAHLPVLVAIGHLALWPALAAWLAVFLGMLVSLVRGARARSAAMQADPAR